MGGECLGQREHHLGWDFCPARGLGPLRGRAAAAAQLGKRRGQDATAVDSGAVDTWPDLQGLGHSFGVWNWCTYPLPRGRQGSTVIADSPLVLLLLAALMGEIQIDTDREGAGSGKRSEGQRRTETERRAGSCMHVTCPPLPSFSFPCVELVTDLFIFSFI